MGLKHLKRVLHISNAFETFETCFEYLQRVWNICNAFETFKTHFKYYKRVLNTSNAFETLAIFLFFLNYFVSFLFLIANIQNTFIIFKTRC